MSGTARKAATAVSERIACMAGPTLPLHEAWSVGLGQILSQQATLPGMLRGAVLKLDRLGRLRISSGSLSLDGVEVPWKKIKEIKFGSASSLLMSRAIDHEIKRLTSLLPPVPRKDWLVGQAVEVLVALCRAAAAVPEDEVHRRGASGVEAAGVPLEITYRRFLRQKKLTPGLFVTLVAALVPGTSQAIAVLARQHGVKIVPVASTRYDKYAVAMADFAAGLSRRIRGGDEPGPAEYGASDGSELLEAGEANPARGLPKGRLPAEQADAPALERGPDDAQAPS